jgi:hypothetical protein
VSSASLVPRPCRARLHLVRQRNAACLSHTRTLNSKFALRKNSHPGAWKAHILLNISHLHISHHEGAVSYSSYTDLNYIRYTVVGFEDCCNVTCMYLFVCLFVHVSMYSHACEPNHDAVKKCVYVPSRPHD